MTTKEIKKKVNNHFKDNNFINAYKILNELDSVEFIEFGIKKNFFNKKEFWNSYVIDLTVLNKLFTSQKANELLYYYFLKSQIVSPNFEQFILYNLPDLYIESVRVSQTFLNNERLKILKSFNFPESHSVYLNAFIQIQTYESNLWQEIETELNNISKLPLENILIQSTFWLENERFQKKDSNIINHLGNVYSLFIRLILDKIDDPHISEKRIFEAFTLEIKRELDRKVNPLHKLLSLFDKWENYNSNYVSPFSFDMNMIPRLKQTDEVEFTYMDLDKLNTWNKNGERIILNNYRYIFKARGYTEYLISNDKLKIPGKSKESIQNNIELHALEMASKLFINDLGITNLTKDNEILINSNDILTPLIAYSKNKVNRYEDNILNLSKTSSHWIESLIKLTHLGKKNNFDCEPFFLMSEENYIKTNQNAIPHVTLDAIKYQLDLFSYKKPNHKFNRFIDDSYDVATKPFIKLGEMIFCPMLFFANNTWFYSFAIEAIKEVKNNNTELESAQLMETELSNLFSDQKLNSKCISSQESDKMEKGDIDIFIWDDDNTLLIQLKRSFLRRTLKSAYFERVNSENKAIKQLINGKIFLEQPSNGIFELKGKTTLWFVSTSFEDVQSEIHGCKKINYFELLWALQSEKFNSVKTLIDYMENDSVFKKSKTMFEID